MALKHVIRMTAAVALFAALTVTVGCGGSDKKGGDDPVGSGDDDYVFDSRLVLGANQAWIDTFAVGDRDGFIFDAEGGFIAIDDDDGDWAVKEGGIVIASDGVLEVTSGDLYYHLEEGNTATYVISGSKLSLTVTLADGDTYTYVFTKASDIAPTAKAKPRSLAKRSAKKALLR